MTVDGTTIGRAGQNRSWLYVPGDRPERVAKAMAAGADAVIVDLEDAVAVPAKDAARANAVAALDDPRPDGLEVWVRVNQGVRGLADIEALTERPGLTGVLLPKASTATIAAARPLLGGHPAVALVESAATLLELPALARADGVVALAMGEVDLAADLGIEASPDGAELTPIRLDVVVASAAAELIPPVGPVWVAVRDLDGLAASTADLRRRGFGGRQVIHPDQVAPVNDAFTPTAEAAEAARALLAGAADAGTGVWVDADGRMVDEAVLRAARRTAVLADRWLP